MNECRWLSIMAKYITLIILIFFCGVLNAKVSGIKLGQTRIVYSESDNAQTLTIYNYGSKNYLIQSSIYLDDKLDKPAPFIITPPLLLVRGDSQQIMKILKTDDERIPRDRESVFYMAVLSIPSHEKTSEDERLDAKVSMGFRFILKLFFRPDGIGMPKLNEGCSLKVTQNGNKFTLKNPTPFFQTLGYLAVNNEKLNLDQINSMIAPMSENEYLFDRNTVSIEWKTVNDYGGLSSTCKK